MPTVEKYKYEILFVNDGSADNTVPEIKAECKKNPAIKLISFTRNFGHQNALSAGYQYVKGHCVVTIDADLQDPPELIDKMIAWQKGFEIVYAHRRSAGTKILFSRDQPPGFFIGLSTKYLN